MKIFHRNWLIFFSYTNQGFHELPSAWWKMKKQMQPCSEDPEIAESESRLEEYRV